MWYFVKKFIPVLFILCFLSQNATAFAQEEDEEECWSIKERGPRIFYVAHGTAIWGHEFGFFKPTNNCSHDIFYLSWSSSYERIADFKGKDFEIQLEVDKESFLIIVPLLTVFTFPGGITHLMSFTNLTLEESVMDALVNGRSVTVNIVGPKEVEGLLDFKEDTFDLEGLKASRDEAEAVCKGRI